MNDITDTIVPWGLHTVKPWVIKELESRASDYGYKSYTSNNTSRVGTHAIWTRVFSNGVPTKVENGQQVNDDKGFSGFLLTGVPIDETGQGFGFKDSYGFNSGGIQYIGVDANGKRHGIKVSEYKTNPHRPSPSIESIDVELAGGQNAPFSGMCRKTTIRWKCYSLDQLEYLTPYFLSPKVSCVIEWGWDSCNPESLAPINSVEKLRTEFEDMNFTMKAIVKSNGNYDRVCGIITDYSFTIDSTGAYDCQTTMLRS